MSSEKYIGRFAPSPTGPLHFGSLVTAVASFFQAKHNNGKWLVRIEDIDKKREQKGASDSILKTLDSFQLYWDDDVIYQSSRLDYYFDAIEKLHKLNRLYRCTCSRKTIQLYIEKQGFSGNKPVSVVYPGICRNKKHSKEQPHSLRLLVHNQTIHFNDIIQGRQIENIQQVGDFVIQQMDGTVTYQLAVAIDDAKQNMTEVVRGIDLISSCFRQILILKLLNYPIPQYCHLPIVCHKDGSKLSKQTGASAINNTKTTPQLWKALSYLSQSPPLELQNSNIQELHSWAKQNWDITKISNTQNALYYQ
ncbi:MAG: tRNA glutamyl-Q(34) synthetase GluQRS [Thiohalomonadales bacterium]